MVYNVSVVVCLLAPFLFSLSMVYWASSCHLRAVDMLTRKGEATELSRGTVWSGLHVLSHLFGLFFFLCHLFLASWLLLIRDICSFFFYKGSLREHHEERVSTRCSASLQIWRPFLTSSRHLFSGCIISPLQLLSPVLPHHDPSSPPPYCVLHIIFTTVCHPLTHLLTRFILSPPSPPHPLHPVPSPTHPAIFP